MNIYTRKVLTSEILYDIIVALSTNEVNNMATAFNKDDFIWDGMYLMYCGDAGEMTEYYEQPCHPTREGMIKAQFIARFKYGSKPWKTFVNALVKHFTVEEYLRLSEETSPVQALNSKGILTPQQKKMCRNAGVPATIEAYNKI